MATTRQLQAIAAQHGTPVLVIDHEIIRRNYAKYKRHLPRVQAYYAVKANPVAEIVRTLYDAGSSFDVASLQEFMLVYENIKHLPPKDQQDFIWDKIIFANPTKPKETLQKLDRYKPLVTYDNRNELLKIKQYAPHAGVVLRLRVPNTGSMVELSSKFGCDSGEAVDLICAAFDIGLEVEGLSFHVGSQCANFDNFVQALNIAAAVSREASTRGHNIKILDIGGGFPVAYDRHVRPFSLLARTINTESTDCSRKTFRSLPSRADFSWPRPPPLWHGSSVKQCATESAATLLTTVSITRFPESFLTIANIISRRLRKAQPKSARSTDRPAMGWTPSRNPSNCLISKSMTWSIRRTSAPTATLLRPGSTDFRLQPSFTSTSKGPRFEDQVLHVNRCGSP